jgi:uncharacterized protein YndB with AHSA1/START domain
MADDTLIASASIDIRVPATKVWKALTQPEIIKKWFFGSDIVTDWKEGHPILYKGEWQGKAYEDKGVVLKVEPEKLLVVTHWSPLGGTADVPENYHTVTYRLSPRDKLTRVTITQSNSASEEERKHFSENWKMVLEGLKKVVEG